MKHLFGTAVWITKTHPGLYNIFIEAERSCFNFEIKVIASSIVEPKRVSVPVSVIYSFKLSNRFQFRKGSRRFRKNW